MSRGVSVAPLAPLVRVAVRATWRSWRWVPAYVLVATALGILYATPSGAAIPAFAATTVLLVPVAAWLVAAAGNSDDAAHQRLLVAATSRPAVHASRALAGGALVAPLVVLATVGPIAAGVVTWSGHPHGLARAVVGGLLAHAVGALSGITVGTFAHRPLLERPGAAAVVAALASSVVVVSPALLPFLRALGHDRVRAVAWAAPLAGATCAVGVLVAGLLAARRS